MAIFIGTKIGDISEQTDRVSELLDVISYSGESYIGKIIVDALDSKNIRSICEHIMSVCRQKLGLKIAMTDIIVVAVDEDESHE